MNIAIIAGTLMLCIVTVVLNLGVMSYYRSKITDVCSNMVPFIYFVLSVSDFATGICAGLHTILFSIMLGLRGRELCDNILWLLVPAYFLSVVAFKVSAYVSLLFAVIRTINISYPFYQVNRKAAIASIAVWFSFWLVVSLVEMGLEGTHLKNRSLDDVMKNVLVAYFYQPNKPKLVQRAGLFYNPESEGEVERSGVKSECLVDLLYTALPVFLCAGLSLIATLVQVIVLFCGSTVGGRAGYQDGFKKRVGVTVILIGLVFITCSSCTLYQPLQVCFHGYTGDLRVLYFMGYFPFFINAALNPLILVTRVQHLRECVWNRVTRKRCEHCCRGRPLSSGASKRRSDLCAWNRIPEKKCEHCRRARGLSLSPGASKRRSDFLTWGTELRMSWSFSSSGFRGFLRSISGQSNRSSG